MRCSMLLAAMFIVAGALTGAAAQGPSQPVNLGLVLYRQKAGSAPVSRLSGQGAGSPFNARSLRDSYDVSVTEMSIRCGRPGAATPFCNTLALNDGRSFGLVDGIYLKRDIVR